MFARRFYASATLAIFALAISLTGCGGGSAPPTHAGVTVDFAQSTPVKSMSGFLQAISQTNPGDDEIAPLQPRFWRSGPYFNLYGRVRGFGARFCVNCAEDYGYNRRPYAYEDAAAYQDAMRQIAENLSERSVIFDILNEPDNPEFFHGTRQQFLDTFKAGHDAIRSVRPDALIAGPSMTRYNHAAIQQFLDYCLANHVRLDVLTWHEFRVGDEIPNISVNLEEARRDFVNNPVYAPLGIKEIQINEAISSPIQFKTASTLAVLNELELGGADAAAHACWPESTGDNNCTNNTLNGLVTPGTLVRRGVWWAYKAYADGADSRVASASTAANVFALASNSTHPQGQAPGPGQVIVAVYGGRSGKIDLTLNHVSAAAGVGNAAQVHLTVQRLLSTGETPLPALPAPTVLTVPVTSDSVQTTVNLGSEEAAVVTITPA